MSDELLVEMLRTVSQPLKPIPTGTASRLTRLQGIRAVVFDIYGTLIISGSGDVGTASEFSRPAALNDALQEVFGPRVASSLQHADVTFERFLKTIHAHHSRLKEQGIQYPEVDIVAVWGDVFRCQEDVTPQESELKRLSVAFEVRANPTWPMPDCRNTLAALKSRGIILGIVSNAQFFTRLLFPAYLKQDTQSLGFEDDLSIFSYEHLRAKPGLELYELLQEALPNRGLVPEEVLYVGNDMRNDIWPAATLGFRTALFAGDQRSLRLRADDPRVEDVVPDLVIESLSEILQCTESQT